MNIPMRLFIFDIDGTITDSVVAHQSSFLKAFNDAGITKVDTNWGSYTHHTDSWIFAEVFRQKYGRDPTREEVSAFSSAVSRNFEAALLDKSVQQIPGSVNFVRQIAEDSRCAYAFATGSFRPPAIRKLNAVGIEFPTELLVTASEFEAREEIVTGAISAAEKYFGVSTFRDIISIGDGYWDFVAAKNLKLEFIGIANGQNCEKLKAAGAVNMFPDFLGSEIISKWCGCA